MFVFDCTVCGIFGQINLLPTVGGCSDGNDIERGGGAADGGGREEAKTSHFDGEDAAALAREMRFLSTDDKGPCLRTSVLSLPLQTPSVVAHDDNNS
jgi:hypothetical protein